MDLTQIDRCTEFLKGIPESSLATIMNFAETRAFPPGSVLFTEGSRHADFHLVILGHIRLEMMVPNRGRVPLLTVGSGEMLAWSALLSQTGMTTSAMALDHVRTAAINGIQFQKFCEQQPDVGYYVMKQVAAALSRRLLATRLQLLDLFAEQEPRWEAPHAMAATPKPG